MNPLFVSQEEVFSFYKNGDRVEQKTEVRFDPLTGESSRLVVDPGMQPAKTDYFEEGVETGGDQCPFCPENLEAFTPVFPKEISPEGRIRKGESVVFPNLFPYSKHNGVVVLSEEHYVTLKNFTIPMMRDAFQAAQQYIQQVLRSEEEVMYASINWNYLPEAGGSILHPHLHVVVSEAATNYQSLFDRKSRAFQENHGIEYLAWLYDQEKDGERWIGEKGNTAWMHSFAPKSHYDFQAIFKGLTDITEFKQQDWEDFASGLQAVFLTLQEEGLASFNMSLTFSNEGSPAHARVIPRLSYSGVGTSDMNFFHTLHQEPIVYKNPEKAAAKVRKNFEGDNALP
ncbi:hypothetical protein ACFOGI_16215 [Virgibacillus xinjiangensis]|uniref:Galactose-1-phosphate uridylyltransferase n=1 Tax=Virgibacillus xinjiangensis TaxID=393090 RepID=A0ABV7CZC6_9BACI